ncbi:MAG TPA: hypothetical protein VLM11_13800 [Streptosporangiaceae bacterium]|nr:hypothetical protein [Streptosporangiaceae bacterium]
MAGQIAVVLAMLAVVVLARLISGRLRVPYTIVLVLCGLSRSCSMSWTSRSARSPAANAARDP